MESKISSESKSKFKISKVFLLITVIDTRGKVLWILGKRVYQVTT